VHLVRTPEERFDALPGFPFAPRYVTLPGEVRMHYVDEGPPGAETVLLLHGQPTWSYLYRTVIEGLVSQGLRAVAPDLVGFGRSDKPLARAAHTVAAHVEWLAGLVGAVGLRDLTVVVQDWGGPIGLGLLTARPGLVRRIVAANTALHTAEASLAGRLTWACHARPDGTVAVEQSLLDYQRLTQELDPLRPSLFVQGATAGHVPDNVLAAYDAPFPDETYCAGPRQLPLLMALTPASECARLNRRTLGALARFTGPFLTAFSDGDPATQGWAEVLREHAPRAAHGSDVTIEGAGHFLQEDQGLALASAVAALVQGRPGA
jgi:haloalkane dehalogenase